MSDAQVHDIADVNPRDIGTLQKLDTTPQQVSPVPSYIQGLPIVPEFSLLPPTHSNVPINQPTVVASQPASYGISRSSQEVPVVLNRRESLLPPSEEVDDDEYEINKIVKAKVDKDGSERYLIDWKGYPASARTYEPYKNFNEAAKEYVDTHDIPTTGKK